MLALGRPIEYLPGGEALIDAHHAEYPQKDCLCGCFGVCIALHSLGFADVDQDALAVEAGAVTEDPGQTDLPGGHPGRNDFRVPLPTTGDPDCAGVSAAGLVLATPRVTAGRFVAVAVRAPMTVAQLAGLLDLARRLDGSARLVANADTGQLWPSRPEDEAVRAYLETGVVSALEPDWQVGHFISPFATVTGAGGTLVLVADTYPTLGYSGLHAQPIELLATAITRRDGREGGVLVVCPADSAADVAAGVADLGLSVGTWDNGSPPPST